MAFGKCSNCGKNPCTVDCAKQSKPASSGSNRPDGGDQRTKRQARADAAYQAAKNRQDTGGRPHAVRHLTAKQIANGDLKKFEGLIESSKHDGDGLLIILKKGKEEALRNYE
jgi:hypothetical protein